LITLTILPGAHLGTDGKLHDTYIPADFKVVQGVPVTLKIYNYDDGEHSFTSKALGVNFLVKGSTKKGVAKVNTFTFTPTKAGKMDWHCAMKCDGGMQSYAMTHDGYMKGVVDVVPFNNQQYIDLTIKDGLKYAAKDGKLHDAYSPTDFTVQKGVPVHVTVTNYDTGEHSMTSSALGLNQVMKAAKKTGDPTTTTFTFTPKKDGTFDWHCAISCDGGMSSYSMTHQGYMQGKINVVG
jgi:heme/copper-type cytochrome/quinol oxidase subunit 2